jgi:hypothetical protein
MTSSRSGVGRVSAALTAAFRSSGAAPSTPAIATSSKPSSPVSIERSAFCTDSAKLRPIAIASPTDFIDVDSSGSAPGNFSNVKRGILVTM